MKNRFSCFTMTTVMLIFCATPLLVAGQGQSNLTEEQKRAVEAERAKLKAAGPQRDHSADAEYYNKSVAEMRQKAAAMVKEAAAKPTPHTTDGHPDLNGIWFRGGFGGLAIISPDGKNRKVLFGPLDEGGTKPREPVPDKGPNQPSYKPEYQAKVDANWFDVNHNDPTAFVCLPPGVPRMGEPSQIVQTPGQVVFLYQQGTAGGIPHNTFRVIYTDGRPHRTDTDSDAIGDSVGRWEGDTLVVDVTRLSDETWLSDKGTLHSDATHVTERLTRKGDTLVYAATVEDPKVLTKPWTTTPVTRVLGGKDNALTNEFACIDNDSEHLTGLIHH